MNKLSVMNQGYLEPYEYEFDIIVRIYVYDLVFFYKSNIRIISQYLTSIPEVSNILQSPW